MYYCIDRESKIHKERLEAVVETNLDGEKLDISDNPTLTRGLRLAKLTKLRALSMGDTRIVDISFLLKLKDTLVFLNLSDVPITATDFDYLRELKCLKELCVKRTKIGFN